MAEMYTKKRDFIYYWVKLIQLQLQEYITPKTDTYFATTLVDTVCLKSLQDFLVLEKQKISGRDLMSLSKREKEIAFLLMKGYKRKDIAIRLNIAPKTVDANIEHIKNKTHTIDKIDLLNLLQEPVIEDILACL